MKKSSGWGEVELVDGAWVECTRRESIHAAAGAPHYFFSGSTRGRRLGLPGGGAGIIPNLFLAAAAAAAAASSFIDWSTLELPCK